MDIEQAVIEENKTASVSEVPYKLKLYSNEGVSALSSDKKLRKVADSCIQKYKKGYDRWWEKD